MRIGAQCHGNDCTFTVWAPQRKEVAVHIVNPFDRTVPMIKTENGYWSATIEHCGEGAHYLYRLDNSLERPDPASFCQPLGIHGVSMVVNHSSVLPPLRKTSARRLEEYIIYELHIGTFTPEGTFAAAATHLSELVSLGITAIEIMPVAQFPGSRNWGYDGVYPFAVQCSYGGVAGLRQFVDVCHNSGIAVILDVVYNHLGPEGNYLRDFGPYFTDRYHTPWGESINYDGPYSDDVCAYFIENACYWLQQFDIDALRLDAVHAIFDFGARPFLQRLSERVEQEFGTVPVPRYLIAESDLNDGKIIQERTQYGIGIHAQWSDDFHHALHTVLTDEHQSYYEDFNDVYHLARVMERSFSYDGAFSPFRNRSHGNDVSSFPTGKFVVCSQNHDQIGNRMAGERLIRIAGFERAQCAAAAVLLSPYIPLLFMGEEYGETNPFLYFANHGDDSLISAVREGRKREFAGFFDGTEPPDPFSHTTFDASVINRHLQETYEGKTMLRLYRDCISLRKEHEGIGPGPRNAVSVYHQPDTTSFALIYHRTKTTWLCLFNFSTQDGVLQFPEASSWRKRLDSSNYTVTPRGGTLPELLDASLPSLLLPPLSFAVYQQKTAPQQQPHS